MGLVVIGVLFYFSVVLIGSIYLIVKIIIRSIKVGFKKAIKSKDALDLLIILVLLLGLPAFCLYSMFIPHSGEQLFSIYLIKPVPKSVQVLQSYDGGPDLSPETCLHFRIAPSDLKLILASRKWEPVSKAKYSGYGCDYRNNSWNFHSPTPFIGDDVKIYTYSPYAKDDEFLYVNAQMNEVYYFNVDMGLP